MSLLEYFLVFMILVCVTTIGVICYKHPKIHCLQEDSPYYLRIGDVMIPQKNCVSWGE